MCPLKLLVGRLVEAQKRKDNVVCCSVNIFLHLSPRIMPMLFCLRYECLSIKELR
jgi:hypothetical protein